MIESFLPLLTGLRPDASSEQDSDWSDDLMARLEEKLRLRNGWLIAKLQAWGELLDAVGWSVALDWSDGKFWLSGKASEDLQPFGEFPTTWNMLLTAVDHLAPATLYQKSDGVLIWSSQVTEEPQLQRVAPLTPRESEVMNWICQGKTSPEIAMILGCADRTVDKHLANIYRKIGVNHRASVILNHAQPST